MGEALIPAASICLLDRSGRRVLLGRRRGPPSAGSWAFPGGRSKPGETALQTAIRELAEETGIRLNRPHAKTTHTVLVGRPARFQVTCVVVEIDGAPDPRPGREMEARWIGLREAADLRPMTTGTRRVLREIT